MVERKNVMPLIKLARCLLFGNKHQMFLMFMGVVCLNLHPKYAAIAQQGERLVEAQKAIVRVGLAAL